MRVRNDTRHKDIGGRHRATARYSMLLNRTTNTENDRNAGYAGVEVRVTREEFIEWFRPKDYIGCSVDRLDNTGYYELSNMQIIPMPENNAKDRIKEVNGFTECFSCKEVKPLTGLAKDKRRANGHSTICKLCDNKRRKRDGSTGK